MEKKGLHTRAIRLSEYLQLDHLRAPGMADVECGQLQGEGTEKN